MRWPFICVDRFFQDPKKIVDFSKKLKFEREDNIYPGLRTKAMHLIDPEFFEFTTLKIISAFYPNESKKLKWAALQYFQKVPANLNFDGWIHTDFEFEFTSVIYLSDFKNCGTSVYHAKDCFGYSKNFNKKNEYFSNTKNVDLKDIERARAENNKYYEETIKCHSRFNRLVAFDSNNYHAAEPFLGKEKDERLTLITFFINVSYKTDDLFNSPIDAVNRIN